MATGLPCPNPRCNNRFTRESMRADAVTCPACGLTFRLRGATTPPPVPEPAIVVSPVRHHRRHRGRGFFKGLLVFLAVAGAACGVLYHFRDELREIYSPDPAAVPEEEAKSFPTLGNFSFRAGPGWRQDDALRARSRANLAVSLKKPRGHLALYYRDYKTRGLSDAELLDQALKHLRTIFPQVEYEDPFKGEKKGRTGDLGDEPAVALTFSATDADSVPMRGQCLMLSRRGYAYWLMFWGPEDYQEQLAGRWEQLREGFRLHDERDGWKPAPRPTLPFTGTKLAYQIDFASDVWKKLDDTKEAGPSAELLLRGFEPTIDEETGKPRVVEFAGKAAEVRVHVLPKATDLPGAVAAARELLRKKHAEASPALKIEPVADRKTGQPLTETTVGAFPGQVERLRLELTADNERYARVGVVSLPKGVLVILGECRWDRRDYWEQEFREILGTARPAKVAAADAP